VKVLGLAWIGLVSDRPEMRRFYAEALGLKLLEAEAGFAYFQVDETARLEILASHTGTAARQRADAPALGFLVDDLDGAVHQLQQAGVAFTSEIKEWRSGDVMHRWIYLQDPDRNVLLLLERHGE
jgi:catechol 2,3-dioxygenase-like lactoylglutathione lyase family enzyme